MQDNQSILESERALFILSEFRRFFEEGGERINSEADCPWLTPGDEAILIAILSKPEWIDDTSTSESWNPLHAATLLGHLRSTAAVGPMIDVLVRHEEALGDYLSEEIQSALTAMGAPALSPLMVAAENREHPCLARTTLLDAIGNIGKLHPEERDRILSVLGRMLDEAAGDDPLLMGMVVNVAIRLKGVELIDKIRDAYARGDVSWSFCGSLANVEFLFGLRKSPPRPLRWRSHLLDRWEAGVSRPPVEPAKRNQAKRDRKRRKKRGGR